MSGAKGPGPYLPAGRKIQARPSWPPVKASQEAEGAQNDLKVRKLLGDSEA